MFIGNSLQAQRVVQYGNGLSLSPSDQTPENFVRYTKKLLSEGYFVDRAEQLKKSYSELGGSMQAAELILKTC